MKNHFPKIQTAANVSVSTLYNDAKTNKIDIQ